MKKQTTNNQEFSFQPILRSKYLIILALLGVLAIMTPSYLPKSDLWLAYLIIGFIALITLGLRQNFRFQKIHKKLRPFIVARILQIVATFAFLGIILRTIKIVLSNGPLIPYIIYYLLALGTVSRFYNIFSLAKKAKEDFPDRCEFC